MVLLIIHKGDRMAITRRTQGRVIDLLLSGDVEKAENILKRAGGDWWRFGKRLCAFVRDMESEPPPFKIINQVGNIKLPFAEFSTLPGYTCPGAGECLTYCYSYKAWRYPAAFFRQLQHTLIIRLGRYDLIEEAFQAIPKGAHLRLYVNGDIDSLETLEFWFELLTVRPDVRAYGYSKSWDIFLEYDGEFPENYVLNISNGSAYDADNSKRDRLKSLPITRGEFIGVPIDHKLSGKYGTKDYKSAVRESSSEKGFLCPGRCGECTKTTHACGDLRFSDIPILIGIH